MNTLSLLSIMGQEIFLKTSQGNKKLGRQQE